MPRVHVTKPSAEAIRKQPRAFAILAQTSKGAAADVDAQVCLCLKTHCVTSEPVIICWVFRPLTYTT